MASKARRRLAIVVAGALLAALTLVNIAPVAADGATFTDVWTDPSITVSVIDGSAG